jgi:hypothetical protein
MPCSVLFVSFPAKESYVSIMGSERERRYRHLHIHGSEWEVDIGHLHRRWVLLQILGSDTEGRWLGGNLEWLGLAWLVHIFL